jgi:hypothetical protein
LGISFDRGTVTETAVYFTGNGGGRHYFLEPQTDRFSATHRHVKTLNTSQPLSWYGCNLEAGGSTPFNAEFIDSKNIRIYGIKREGATPTVNVNNCENLAIYGQGAMRDTLTSTKAYVQVTGNCSGILMPIILVQQNKAVPNGAATFRESLNGKPEIVVPYPDGVSVYKLGEINDDAMYRNYTTGVGNKPADDISELTIYPNPAKDFFTLDLPGEHEGASLIIADVSGKQVMRFKLSGYERNYTVSAEGLHSGFYFVYLLGRNQNLLRKGKVLINN